MKDEQREAGEHAFKAWYLETTGKTEKEWATINGVLASLHNGLANCRASYLACAERLLPVIEAGNAIAKRYERAAETGDFGEWLAWVADYNDRKREAGLPC